MALTDLWVLGETQELGGIVALSIAVSVTAAALAGVLGTALGAALAVYRIPGRRIIVMALHALLGLPPVVVGLALYLLLSRAGPFGALGLLFTPAAMASIRTMPRCYSYSPAAPVRCCGTRKSVAFSGP
jgi:tungstate transport system permease protein